MKILLLADTLDVGGAETHIYELSRSLLLSGHKVALLSGGGKTADALKALGVKVTECKSISGLPLSLGAARSSLLSLLREYKPDLVHAHTRKSLFLCESVRPAIHFPLVFTAHAKFQNGGIKGLFTKPPRHTLAVSEDIKRHFAACFGADADNITVIENGIDTDRFSPKEKTAAHNILTVSRLDRDCSLSAELLCTLAPRLARIYPDFRLTVVGGGNDLQKIKELASRANAAIGRKAVVCAGRLCDVLPQIRECDIFAGVSRAALEAMSCNKPVILCGNEGYFGICREENFDLAAKENFCARGYPLPDAERLFADICALFDGLDSQNLRLRERVVKGYRAELMAQKTVSVYNKAIGHFKSRLKYDALLCGYYGFGNAGDELVGRHIIDSLAPMRIAVVGARGGGRIRRFDIPRLCYAIKNSSGVILGGGSLLQNATSRRSLEYYLFILKLANRYGKKVMLYANGIGPLNGKSARTACKKALRYADTVSLRDSASLSAADSILPKDTLRYLTCDPALAPLTSVRRFDRIAIFIRGEDESRELTAALSRCGKLFGNSEAVFAPMNLKRDLRASQRLAASMPFLARTQVFDGTDELVSFISESRFVISSRLHALIIAASSGVPFVALCADPKLKSFVLDCGLPTLLAVPIDSRTGDGLVRAMEYLLENEGEISRLLKQRTAELCRLSKRDAREAVRLFLGEST